MNNATNKDDVVAYQAALSRLSDKGNPWSPSEQDRAQGKAVTGAVSLKLETGEPSKIYFVHDGLTVYQGQYGTYFQRGALVMPTGNKGEDGFIEVEIVGDTFRVIASAGFANESSLFTSSHKTTKGFCNPERTYVKELNDVTQVVITYCKELNK